MSGQPMRHAFVRVIPEVLEQNTLYISIDYVTTSHLCACGCSAEVVLPLHPTKWQLTFNGMTVSMAPSIGSRTLPCRSHYWIDKGRIRWANKMSDSDFELALKRDQLADRQWHEGELTPNVTLPTNEGSSDSTDLSPTHPSNQSVGAGWLRIRARDILDRLFKRS